MSPLPVRDVNHKLQKIADDIGSFFANWPVGESVAAVASSQRKWRPACVVLRPGAACMNPATQAAVSKKVLFLRKCPFQIEGALRDSLHFLWPIDQQFAGTVGRGLRTASQRHHQMFLTNAIQLAKTYASAEELLPWTTAHLPSEPGVVQGREPAERHREQPRLPVSQGGDLEAPARHCSRNVCLAALRHRTHPKIRQPKIRPPSGKTKH